MKIAAKDADAYVAAAERGRRPHLEKVRTLVKKTLPKVREDIMSGMIGHSLDGRTFAALASQKNYMSPYLMDLYAQPGLREAHAEALSKLNMGKSCINFNSVAELPLATIAAILAAAPRTVVTKGKPAAKKAAATKPPPRKPAAEPPRSSRRAR